MHFNAEIVAFRMGRGERQQMIAIAEADFDDPGRRAPEGHIKIQGLSLERDAKLRPQL